MRTADWRTSGKSNLRDFTHLPPERRRLATICAKSVAKIIETLEDPTGACHVQLQASAEPGVTAH
jgi:hypothetical protein